MKARIVVAATALFIAIGALMGVYVYMTYFRVDMSTIKHIQELQKGPNEFNDMSGDINVESVDDLGFIIHGDYDIDIHYGSQIISMNKNCFKSQEFRDRLSKIGVKVYTHADDNGKNVQYKITYWGEDIVELSRVN